MGCFSKSAPASASAKGPCVSCCRSEHAADEQLSAATAARMQALATTSAPASPPPAGKVGGAAGRRGDGRSCAKKAVVLGPVAQRFQRYREALPAARSAADLNELGDKSGDEPSSKPCLTRLPVDAARLDASLGLPPGTTKDVDLRNDETGFRAAMYRDESTGKLILVPRDTQPDCLVDWQTNARNGVGTYTTQYRAMASLTSKLALKNLSFDLAGYSKGGGLAQLGGLASPASQVRIFNSAGLPDEALQWTGQTDFSSLVSRTRLFSADGDLLTFMSATEDPRQTLINARFLRRELAGQGSWVQPIAIKTRNPAMRGKQDPALEGDRAQFLAEIDDYIDRMQASHDGGGAVARFPPARAGLQETIHDSSTLIGDLMGANSDQPSLGKLNQHRMRVVLDSMESNVRKDRDKLRNFLKECG